MRVRWLLFIAASIIHPAPAFAEDGKVKDAIEFTLQSLHEKIQEGRNAKAHMEELRTAVLTRNDATALDEFHKMAKAGNASAMLFLGCVYDQGLGGVATSSYTAAKFFHAAAKQGDVLASYNLGLLFLYGRGIPRNEASARQLFQLAAKASVKYAAVNLGLLAEKNKNWEEAANWYRLAAGASKHDLAKLKYGLFMFRGQGTTRRPQDGLIMIRRAADAWNQDAIAALAEIYANGLSVPQSRQEAAKWIEIARRNPRGFAAPLLQSIAAPLGDDVDWEIAKKTAAIWIDAHPPVESVSYAKAIWAE